MADRQIDVSRDSGDKSAVIGLMRRHPTFARLSEASIAGLIDRSALFRFAGDHVLIRQGDPSDAAFLLLDGEVDVVVETLYGPVHLARRSRHTLLGELDAFANLPRTPTVRTLTAVEVLRIAREDLLTIGRDNPALLLEVIQQLGQHTGMVNRAV